MNTITQARRNTRQPSLSRRGFLARSTAAGAAALLAGGTLPGVHDTAAAATSGGDLHFTAPIPAILEAMQRYPLVALGELHLNQEFHDFLSALLFHPELPGRITDIVVEFGNALYQEIADRFILEGQPVANAELQLIWRNTIGGLALWDAPVYGQFFRNVRAINWMLPRSRRIRVLLGDPPVDFNRVRSLADKDYVFAFVPQRDSHYAGVVEREVLAKGGRALLIAGNGHLLRALTADHYPKLLNAATLLTRTHPGSLFMVDPLILLPGAQQDPAAQRLLTEVARASRPSLAHLAGTWLGDLPHIPSRAVTAGEAYAAQADAVLYLGAGDVLTTSRAEPTIYEVGAYRDQLRRLSVLVTAATGQHVDYVAEGLRRAQLPPSFFAQ
jgi:hypothetical protein